MKTLLMLTAASMVGLSACASMAPTPTSALPYVANAGSSDMFEIQSSQRALQMSQNPEVRRFAEMLIQHHTQTTQSVMAAARQDGLNPPPPMLMPRHAAMLRQLEQAPAGGFDAAYVRMQVPAHQEALALHQTYASGGDRPALRGAAGTAVPIVQGHLEEAQRLQGMM